MLIQTGSTINNLFIDQSKIILCAKNQIFLFDTLDKAIVQVDVTGNCLCGFVLPDKSILYSTLNVIYILKVNGKPEKFAEKDNLDLLELIDSGLLIIKENCLLLLVYSNKTKKCHRIQSEVKMGICVQTVIYKKDLYMAYENGNVTVIKNKDLIKLKEYRTTKDIQKVMFSMCESITSLDISNDKICCSFFSKKVSICDLNGDNFLFTEIKFIPKIIKYWKQHIIGLDEENNLFLLDFNLQLLYCENLKGTLKFINVIDDTLYQVMTDGTVVIQNDIFEYIN